MKIGFLGLGKMGAPMALRLLAAGHELSVWNRTEGRTKPLLREGAIAAATPAEAELGADAVITMLFDDAAHEEVLFGSNGLMDALSPGALHISCSTISVALSERLTAEHARRGIDFVAAPVFGRPNVAEEGRLWIVAAGAEQPSPQRAPVPRAAFARHLRGGHRTAPGPRRQARRQLSHQRHDSLAQRGVCLRGRRRASIAGAFFETVNSALFQSPFYAAYGNVMLHPPEHPGATLELGREGSAPVARGRRERDTRLSLADNLAEIFAEARRTGLSHEDWAVGQYRMAQRRAPAAEKMNEK